MPDFHEHPKRYIGAEPKNPPRLFNGRRIALLIASILLIAAAYVGRRNNAYRHTQVELEARLNEKQQFLASLDRRLETRVAANSAANFNLEHYRRRLRLVPPKLLVKPFIAELEGIGADLELTLVDIGQQRIEHDGYVEAQLKLVFEGPADQLNRLYPSRVKLDRLVMWRANDLRGNHLTASLSIYALPYPPRRRTIRTQPGCASIESGAGGKATAAEFETQRAELASICAQIEDRIRRIIQLQNAEWKQEHNRRLARLIDQFYQ